MKVCPGADATDGLFDVTVVGAMTRLELVRSSPRLTDGTHVDHPTVSVHRGPHWAHLARGHDLVRRWRAGGPAAGGRQVGSRPP